MGKIFCSVDAKIGGEDVDVSLDFAKDNKLGLCIDPLLSGEKAYENLIERANEYGDVRVLLDVEDARALAGGLMFWVMQQEAKNAIK